MLAIHKAAMGAEIKRCICGRDFIPFGQPAAIAKQIHCSPQCRRWAINVQRRHKFASDRLYTCQQCGREFSLVSRGSKGHYCSPECQRKRQYRTRVHRKHWEPVKPCETCGAPLDPTVGAEGSEKVGYKRRRFCNRACAGKSPDRAAKARVNLAKRRAQKLRATPKWACQRELAKVYKLCPPDMVVDHYYPLQGETVSGLHVPDNLQYLSEDENRYKWDRHPDELSMGYRGWRQWDF